MIESLQRSLSGLESELNFIRKEEPVLITQSKKSIQKIKECCKQLSLMKMNYEFKTKEEEVYFFKHLKTAFYSKLFYHQEIFHIECQRPNGGDKAKRKFLKEQLYKISEHFNSHRSLYIYYRMGETNYDDKYFTLIKRLEDKYDPFGNIIQCDDDYSSTHDMLFSRIIANDLLEAYLKKELDNITHPISQVESNKQLDAVQDKSKLNWTASKSALIEVIYSIASAKCVNNGNADIKDIAEFVERMFNIDLGDFYRQYVDLRLRTNRTKFLDKLKEALVNKMNEDDEKDRNDPLAEKKLKQ